MRKSEKVTQRCFDGRSCLTIPVAAEDRVTVICQLGESESAVEVCNASRTVMFQQDGGLARMNDEEIAITTAPIPRRGTPTARTSAGKKRTQWMAVERMLFYGHN